MIFSIGDLITFVVVLLILVVYRALDRNNRSLEKLKRFSDKITENLSALVEQRTAQVKDLSLELQASLKTGKEMLARARRAWKSCSRAGPRTSRKSSTASRSTTRRSPSSPPCRPAWTRTSCASGTSRSSWTRWAAGSPSPRKRLELDRKADPRAPAGLRRAHAGPAGGRRGTKSWRPSMSRHRRSPAASRNRKRRQRSLSS